MSTTAILPREPGTPVPLTAMQARIWGEMSSSQCWLSRRDCCIANIALGSLDVTVLRESLAAVMQRHESLRTRFLSIDGMARQQIDSQIALSLEMVDLSSLSVGAVERESRKLALEYIEEMVDLRSGPVFGARLFRLAADKHVLVCVVDHMVCDGASLAVLDHEIWEIYRAKATGSRCGLHEPTIQFGDYAVWQERTAEDWRLKHEAYWRNRLTGAEPLRLPPGVGLAASPGAVGELASFPFDDQLSRGLRAFAERHRVLLPLVVCAIHAATILRWCGREDSILTFVSNSRFRPELHGMVGFVANFLNLRLTLYGADTYRTFLQKLCGEYYSALFHVDFDRVPDFVQGTGLGSSDLYFNWVPQSSADGAHTIGARDARLPHLEVRPFPIRPSWPRGFVPLYFEIDGLIWLKVNHVPSLFSADTVGRFTQNVFRSASLFLSDPDSVIARYE